MYHNHSKLGLPTFILLVLYFFSGCSKSGSNPISKTTTPTITSISLTFGPYNTAVTITGTGFSTTIANNQLFFNGKAAVIGDATSTQLYTNVPLSAGTGNVTVTVNGTTVTGPVFTYQPAEVVTPFVGSPSSAGSINGMGTAATFYQPYGLALDGSGNLYVADQANNLIRKVTPSGVVSTFAGSGATGSADGNGVAASFNGPEGVAVDAVGNVYVADTFNNLIRKITPSGLVSTLAGTLVKGYSDGTGTSASFNRPSDLAVDVNGNLYVTDLYNYRIRKITPSGSVSTFAGNSSGMLTDGTGTAASFLNPTDICIDKTGNLYVTEGGDLIRKITPSGVVTCIAGTSIIGGVPQSNFAMPQGIAVDPNGNIFIEDSGRYQINELNSNGQLVTFAGTGNQVYNNGIIGLASFNFLEGIVIDANDNIYVSESNYIRKIYMQ